MYNHLWAVDKEGSYYTLKNGHTTEASYLQTPANSTTGESVFTASSKGSTANWILEPYTGGRLESLIYTSQTGELFVGEDFTFSAYMYDSDIGKNGPVTFGVANTDWSATDKATMTSYGKLTALKPGVVRVYATYEGALWRWYLDVTIRGTNVIQDVPTTLRSNSQHYCIPCAITNIAGYWSNHGYSGFNCGSAALQETTAVRVQSEMYEKGGSYTANANIQYGFDIFQHGNIGLESTNYWHDEFTYMDIVYLIDQGYPLMLGFAGTSDSPYSEGHMTVCVGYEFDGSDFYVYVSEKKMNHM